MILHFIVMEATIHNNLDNYVLLASFTILSFLLGNVKGFCNASFIISYKPFLIFDGRFLKAAQYWLSVILCYIWIHPDKFDLWNVVSRHKEMKTSLRMGIVSIHMMNFHNWLYFLTLCEKWVSLLSRNKLFGLFPQYCIS